MVAEEVPPQEAWPTPGAPDRFQEWAIDSPEAATAAEGLAERAKVSVASTVMAAWCLALDAIDGDRNHVAMTLISGNRHREREQQYVGPLTQDTLFSVAWPDGCGIDEFAALVHKQALSAYSNGRYDPLSLDAALGSGSHKVLTFFNHARRALTRPVRSAVPATLVTAGEPRLRGQWPFLDLHRFLVLQDAPGCLRLRLLVDTGALAQPGAAAMLTGICEILTRAAAGATPRELKATVR
jgi:hypothetical protein